MTVSEIVKKYLDDNGFDGLCGEDCGCSKDNLFPCCDAMTGEDCQPGYRVNCDKSCEGASVECFSPKKTSDCIMGSGE